MLIEVDKELMKVLDDYHECCSNCDECSANKDIPGTGTSYCDFLLKNRSHAENIITRAIEKI